MRVFRPSLWVFAALLVCLVRPAFSGQTNTNVVVITIDTLRADHVGCYGYKKIHTPNIDGLAADGFRFEKAFTPVPITLPSHTVIFTGTYPMLNGMHDFSGNRLGSEPPTLAAVLKQHGYTTGAVVAAAVLDSRFGLSRGFDFYYDHFDFNRLQESNLDEMERPGNVVANEALRWLGENYPKKFFLWMHLYDPHYPYNPPAAYQEQYKSHPYDGEIAFADEQVGRVIRFLKEKKLYERTIIVLTGDHGEGLGEHGEKTHGFFIYNSTLHIPLIVHLPDQPKGKVVGDPVSTADIMPTILDALQLPAPAGVQGSSMLAEMGGKAEQASPLYAETFLPRLHFNWSELRGVEVGKYHFIEAPKPELYDVSKDPGELNNLYAEKKAVSEEMRAKLGAIIRQYTKGKELAEKTGLDPALMERLKSLGYAGFSGGSSPTISDAKLPDPKDRIEVYELVSEGMADSQHGRYEKSVEELTTALKTEPDSVPIHYLLGLNYYRLKDYGKAIEEFQRVLKLSPDYALATFELGLAYGRVGRNEDAIAALKRALELDPTNFSAAFNLGIAYLHMQMIPESTDSFRKSVSIYPDFAPGHKALGEMLVYQGKVDEGLEELRTAVKLAPGDPQNHEALAKALEQKGLHAEAQMEMQKAQEQQ